MDETMGTWYRTKSNSGVVLQVNNQGNINRLAWTKQWCVLPKIVRTGLQTIFTRH
ncbi:MAG: hypothetical protein N4A74_07475 [Carboxylicivirga sp.]|nr:hypothetical protein [Carboxylicivirga sp.]